MAHLGLVAIDRRSCHPLLIPMRFASAVLAASFVCALQQAQGVPRLSTDGLSLAAQSPVSRPETHELADTFPGNPKVDQFVLSADGQRTYFVNSAGEAWLFDRTRKTSTRLAAGPLWDLNVSPAGDALAYTKAGDRRGDQFVWVLPLNPATGVASAAAISAFLGSLWIPLAVVLV